MLKASADLDDGPFMAALRRMSHGVEELHEKMEETGPGRRLLEAGTALGIYEAARSVMEFGAQLKNNIAMTDLSAESYQRLAFAFGATGTEQEMFSRGMQSLEVKMEEALAGNEKVIKAFAEVGISLSELQEHAQDSEHIIKALADGVRGAEEPTKAMASALELLGRGGRVMMAGLKEGGEGLDDLSHKITLLTEKEIEELHGANHAYEEFWRNLKVGAFHAYKSLEALSDWMGEHNIWGGGEKHPTDVWDKMREERKHEPGGIEELERTRRDNAAAQAEDARLAEEHKKEVIKQQAEETKASADLVKQQAKDRLDYYAGYARQLEAQEKLRQESSKRAEKDFAEEEYEELKLTHEKKLEAYKEYLSKVEQMNRSAREAEGEANQGLVHNRLAGSDQLRSERREQQREDRAQRRVDSMERDRELHPERHQLGTRPGENKLFKDLKGAKDAVKLTQDTINSLSKALAKEMEIIIVKP